MFGQSKNTGFTLIELMVVVALVAIAAAYAVPSFTGIIAHYQVTSTTNNFVGFLNYARSESVKRGRTVRVGPLDGASWDSGARLWVDGDGNNTFDAADDELRRIDSVPGNVALTESTTVIGFRANGYLTPSTAAEFSLEICNSNAPEGRDVLVGFSGRVRTAERSCP